MNQSKLFAENQKIKTIDDISSVYDTLNFKKKNNYTPLRQDEIFKSNSFVSQEAYFRINNFMQPAKKKVY